MNNSFKVNTFFHAEWFQFFTANYGKGSAYSCITNILHYLTRIQKQRLSKEFNLNKTEQLSSTGYFKSGKQVCPFTYKS